MGISRYIMTTALRDRLIISLFLMFVASMIISLIFGSSSLAEQKQTSVIFIAGAIRIISAIGITVFICSSVRKLFENKEIEFILAKSITRNKYILETWMGYASLCLLITIPACFFLACVGIINVGGFAIWSLSIVLESILIATFALAAALTLKSIVASTLATIGFYIASRMVGFFLATVMSPRFDSSTPIVEYFAKPIMMLSSIAIPRLDLFAKSNWLIYGAKTDELIFIAQAAVFIPLLIAVIIYDFNRKQFDL